MALIGNGVAAETPDAAQAWRPLPEAVHKSERDQRQYQAIRLANGMTVLLISDPNASLSLAAIALPIGSLDDPDSQPGLAHYLEHMVLMGSHRYPQPENLAEFLEKHGGSYNASTASYRTAFYLEVENDALAPAVDRLADALAAPLLDPVNADKERHAVDAELTMARSRDGMRLGMVDAETLNPAHPASRFSGGNLQTLSDKPSHKLQDELVQFWQRYYSARLMKGVLYGNQPLSELADIAARSMGRIADHPASVPAITVPVVTEKQKGIVIHYVPAVPQKQLRIDFRIPNDSEAWRNKTDTFISYLIENRSANTLADWLKSQGLADAVSADSDPVIDRNGGLFTIAITLTKKGLQQRETVVSAVFRYLNLLKEKGIDQRYYTEMAQVLDQQFRYPVITRDMDYIEWLVDLLLRVPVSHALDAPYRAEHFDRDAIAARLAQMTPQNARIWFISPGEPHNKEAYFVQAPYQVEPLTPARIAHWHKQGETLHFALPTLNPYIANDFTVWPVKARPAKPQSLIDEPGLRVFSMPSQYFTDEPRAVIRLLLRNAQINDDARHQVLAALNDYLAGLTLDRTRDQALVAGIDFSTSIDHGLVFNASGFTQHLTELVLTMLRQYAAYTATEAQFEQARAWYRERLDAAEKGKAFELAYDPVRALNTLPYSERTARRQALKAVSLADVLAFRDEVLHTAAPELLVVGNLPDDQVSQFAYAVKKALGSEARARWRAPFPRIDHAQKARLARQGASSDAALAAAYISPEKDEIRSMASSAMLSQILSPWFYNQLRTEEQLGYAVFVVQSVVGRQWGVTFLLQSNHQPPAYLFKRYQAFYRQAEQRLSAMSEAEFAQYRQGKINELLQRPQTMEEEAARFKRDFLFDNDRFDSREQLIAQIRALTAPTLAEDFRRTVIAPQGLALLSQVSGRQKGLDRLAKPQEWRAWPTVSALQRTLPVEKTTP